MGDLPLAIPLLEAVDVASSERLHDHEAVIIDSTLACTHVALDPRGVVGGEVDLGVGDRVHRGVVTIAQPRRHVLGEVDAQTLERSVVVGGVRMVDGSNQRGVAPIDAPAVVDQPPLDGSLVEEALHVGIHRHSVVAVT